MSDQDSAYMGRADCGHVVAIMVDNPNHRKDTGKEIARWVRSGLTVEHTTVEVARSQLDFAGHRVCQETRKAELKQTRVDDKARREKLWQELDKARQEAAS